MAHRGRSTRSRLIAALATAVGMLAVAGCTVTRELRATATTAPDTTVPESTAAESTTSTTTTPSTSTTTSTTSTSTTGPPTTDAPTTTAPPRIGEVLTAPVTLQFDETGVVLPAGFSCEDPVPADLGFTVLTCDQAPSYNDGVIALTLQGGSGELAVAALFEQGGQFRQRFVAEFPSDVLSGIEVELSDLNGDDGVEVWIGYHYLGTGGFMDLDVIDPRPDGSFFVGGLSGLEKGAGDIHPGGVTVRNALYASTDPGCCPSLVVHREVFFAAGQWQVDAGAVFDVSAEPPIVADL